MVIIKQLPIETVIPLGLGLVGWDNSKINKANDATNMERWKSMFVPTPQVCSICFHDLQTTEIVEGKITNVKISVVDFLMTLNWLSNYPTMTEMSNTWKMTEKTIHGKVKKYIKAIQALKHSKVRNQVISKKSTNN